MRRPTLRLLAVLPLLGAAAPAPLLLPARDVTVDYRVTADDQPPRDVEAAIAAGEPRARVTGEGLPGEFILDLGRRRATIILAPLRMYREFKLGQSPFPPVDGVYHLKGPRRVAGLVCTVYDVRLHRGGGTICVTPDGVILAAEGEDDNGHKGALEATRVVFGPVPPDAFQVPPGFTDMSGALGKLHLKLD